jgi:predicted DNA-binding transcriptional regulator AlpA
VTDESPEAPELVSDLQSDTGCTLSLMDETTSTGSDIPDEPLTSRQAARLVGVADETLRTWRVRGQGPRFLKFPSGTIRYRRSDVESWIQGAYR